MKTPRMNKLVLTALTSLIGGVGLAPVAALAQDTEPSTDAEEESPSEGSEEVITVTGRRQYRGDFKAIEVPQAEQVIDEGWLRDTNTFDLTQALDLSASVARQNNFGGLWNAFSVRGFSGDINLPSNFLVNGFNAGRGFGGPRDISGIETVEILKGPRSALYGRGEPGGTVNLVSKRPQFETSGYAQFQGGSFDFYRGDGDVQTTLGENIGVRIAGFYEDAGSFRGPIDSERFGVFPSITALLGGDTTVTYELEYSQQDIPFDRGVVFAEGFGFSPRRTFTGEPQDGGIDTDVLGHQLEVRHDFSDHWRVLAGLGYRDTSLEGNATENNFVGRQTFNLDGQTISRFFRSRDFDSTYLVARAEISGEFESFSLENSLIVGVDYDRFDNSMVIGRFRGASIPEGAGIGDLNPQELLFLDAFNPVFGRFPPPAADSFTDRDEVFDGFGIYYQDQVKITDELQLRFGGRFDRFEQDLTNNRADPPTTVTSSDSRFSPQVGAVYLLDEGLSVYASYGEGFRQQTGSDFQGNQFEPNITRSVEIGTKADLGTYLDFVTGFVNVAAFSIDQSNFLVNDDRPEASGAFSFPAGEARSQGLELDANLAFDFGLNTWLSYAYVDAEFTNTNPSADFLDPIEEGDPLINTPNHQLSLQASQDFQLIDLPASVGGGLLYVGERNGFVGTDFELPSYTTVRLFAELEVADGLVLRGDVDNVFNSTYYTNSFADVWVQPGLPITFRGTARYSF